MLPQYGNAGSIPGVGRNTGERTCNHPNNTENPLRQRVRQAMVHGVTESWTHISELLSPLLFFFLGLEQKTIAMIPFHKDYCSESEGIAKKKTEPQLFDLWRLTDVQNQTEVFLRTSKF